MITVYIADSKSTRMTNKLSDLLLELPENMHSKAFRYRFERDAYNYVLGRLLLKKGLKDLETKESLLDLTLETNDKPILPKTFFNISHSGDLVVCAVSSNTALGIDIELERSIELKNFRSSFSDKEWQEICESERPLSSFFWYWTRKESIIKALGKNLSYLHEIEIDSSKESFEDQGQKWHLSELHLGPKVFGAICTKSVVSIEYEAINF